MRHAIAATLVMTTALCAPPATGQTPATPEADPWDEPAPAAVRDQEARQLFRAGHLAFTDGRFEDALGYFQRSYELSERPALLFNIAASLDRLQRKQEALEYFQRYLRDLPEAPNRAEVQGRIDQLQESIEREQRNQEEIRRARAERDRLLLEQRDDEPTVLEQWWFWTIVGAAVAGGVVAVILLAGGEETEGPLAGNTGVITVTLGGP